MMAVSLKLCDSNCKISKNLLISVFFSAKCAVFSLFFTFSPLRALFFLLGCSLFPGSQEPPEGDAQNGASV
ncbi:MAG: hypothetical protein IJ243_05210 [Prevotella sp.]|nr:hypothetical protein [Prevotella sp.]